MSETKVELDLARFRKVCGMLGSSSDGERASAAARATDMLRSAGLSWSSVSISTSPPTPQRMNPFHGGFGQTTAADIAELSRREQARRMREAQEAFAARQREQARAERGASPGTSAMMFGWTASDLADALSKRMNELNSQSGELAKLESLKSRASWSMLDWTIAAEWARRHKIALME